MALDVLTVLAFFLVVILGERSRERSPFTRAGCSISVRRGAIGPPLWPAFTLGKCVLC